MAIRRILAPITGAGSDEAFLRTGMDLAQRFSAHLSCYGVVYDPIRSLVGSLVDQYPKAIEQYEKAQTSANANALRELRILFEKVCLPGDNFEQKARKIDASWRKSRHGAGALVRSEGRVSDLILLARLRDLTPLHDELLKEAVFNSGKLVVVCGMKPEATLGKNILIAWNCSREATRAVSAAMPMLESAEKVQILSAGAMPPEGPSAVDLSRFLRRHDVSAEICWTRHATPEPALLLQQKALDMGADLVVMGAFTHKRGRQHRLGDVTRFMLEETELPIATCH